MNEARRRQSSAEWASHTVTDLCDDSKAWTTGWRPLRAHSDDDIRKAVAKADELNATGDLFAKHIESGCGRSWIRTAFA